MDEMTGVQALEHKYLDKPVCLGSWRCMSLNTFAMAP